MRRRDFSEMKIKLNAYKFAGTLKREFRNMEEAEGIARLMEKKYPDMVFQPHMELSDSSVIDLSDWDQESTQEIGWEDLEKTIADLSDLDEPGISPGLSGPGTGRKAKRPPQARPTEP